MTKESAVQRGRKRINHQQPQAEKDDGDFEEISGHGRCENL